MEAKGDEMTRYGCMYMYMYMYVHLCIQEVGSGCLLSVPECVCACITHVYIVLYVMLHVHSYMYICWGPILNLDRFKAVRRL